MTAEISLKIGDAQVTIMRDVEHRERDRVRGELRRRIDVVPAISVEPATDSIIVPASSASRTHEIQLTFRNNATEAAEGTATISVPDDWTLEPESTALSLGPGPETTTLAFQVTMPADVAAGSYSLAGSASVDSEV